MAAVVCVHQKDGDTCSWRRLYSRNLHTQQCDSMRPPGSGHQWCSLEMLKKVLLLITRIDYLDCAHLRNNVSTTSAGTNANMLSSMITHLFTEHLQNI